MHNDHNKFTVDGVWDTSHTTEIPRFDKRRRIKEEDLSVSPLCQNEKDFVELV